MEVVNLAQKMTLFPEAWKPRIVAELNGQQVKVARLRGEFLWHSHAGEDELFLVLKGTLRIRLRDRDLVLREGEMTVIPRGVEHCPVAEEEVHLLLFEPAGTANTGDRPGERTAAAEWI